MLLCEVAFAEDFTIPVDIGVACGIAVGPDLTVCGNYVIFFQFAVIVILDPRLL